MHAALELLEARPAAVEGDDLAVEDRVARAERRPERAQLRVAGRDVVAVAALEPQPPAVDVADRAHAVPLDLVGPARRRRAGACRVRASIGCSRSGIGSRSGSSGGSMRWIIQSSPRVRNRT